MEELLKILSELHPEVDFENEKSLLDNNIFDSFDIISVIAEVSEQFDVVVSAEDIIPDNFNSAEAIYELILRLQNN
ncbi:MAG: acyl carrier protein [Lachnospiraceae bacterium]|nr:acyl carrier protein [Lachnospiraceae bacterium]